MPTLPETNELAVEVRSLSKHFGSKQALRGVSFGIEKGSIFGLLGPNGAGKTTTLKILACHLAPSEGSVTVLGRPWAMEDLSYKRDIGFLTREMSLYEKLSVQENMIFFGSLRQANALNQQIEELTQRLTLTEIIHRPYGKLSTGQKQRANIAVALLHQPKLLILDEITASLDIIACREVLDLVKDQARLGTTVIYSTHIMGEVEYMCNSVSLLHEGRVVALGSPTEILQDTNASNMTEAFYHAVDRAKPADGDEDVA